MRRNQWIALAGILTLAIAGCSSEEAPPPVTTAPAPNPATSPVAIAPKPGQSPAAQSFNAPKPVQPAVSGLIPSTNYQERAQQVKTEIGTGRTNDPFTALPTQLPKPVVTQSVPQVAQLPANRPNPANAPGRNNAPAGAAASNKKEVATPAIPKVSEPLGVNLPPARPTTGVAALPSTDTARGVEVTGVVVVGGLPQAIVIAPGEGTSRYVSPGQRVSGGRVLVKRIESATGAEPVVILEENGVEVARSVGEKPPQAAKPAA